MNAERLGLVIRRLKEDFDRSKLIARLNQLVKALNTLISSPGEEQQKAVMSLQQEIQSALSSPRYFKYPNTWNTILEDIGVARFLGEEFLLTILEILGASSITPLKARDQLQALVGQLTEQNAAFIKIIEGFGQLNIVDEPLEPGSAEISFLLPREAFSSELNGFAVEIKSFDRILRLFSEIATGSREPPKIKQLSTTDPLVLVALGTPAVLLALSAVEKILIVIERTYKIREAKATAEKAEIGRNILRQMDEEATAKISTGLDEIRESILEEYPIQKERKNELDIELREALKFLATRLDNGYRIDGDAGLIAPAGEEGVPDPNAEQAASRAIQIQELAQRIRYREIPIEPVLNLPKPTVTEEKGEEPVSEKAAT